MRTLTLKPKHRDSVLFKLQAAAKSIRYHEENISPNFDAMEQWEIKEYKIVNDIAKDNFNKLKDFMIENESVFNLMLAEYNLSVVTFIAINS